MSGLLGRAHLTPTSITLSWCHCQINEKMLIPRVLTLLLAIATIISGLSMLKPKYRTKSGYGFRIPSRIHSTWSINNYNISRTRVAQDIVEWVGKREDKGEFKLAASYEFIPYLISTLKTKDKFKNLFHPISSELGDELYNHLSLIYSESEILVDDALIMNRESFNISYINPKRKVTNQFVNYIEYCLEKYRRGNKIFAPYFVFCQSSGYGKSRLIKQLAIEHSEYSLLYFCLRKKDNFGYPAASLDFIDDLTRAVIAGKSAENAVIFFQKWVEYLCAQHSYPSWNDMEASEEPAVKFMKESIAAAQKNGTV